MAVFPRINALQGARRGDGTTGVIAGPTLAAQPTSYTYGGWFRFAVNQAGLVVKIPASLLGVGSDASFSYDHTDPIYTQAFYQRNAVGTYVSSKFATTLVAGRWYHLMAVWDGATLTVYRNGMQENSVALTSLWPGTNTLSLFARAGGPDAYTECAIAGFGYWHNAALVKGEVLALAQGALVTGVRSKDLYWAPGLGSQAPVDLAKGNTVSRVGTTIPASPPEILFTQQQSSGLRIASIVPGAPTAGAAIIRMRSAIRQHPALFGTSSNRYVRIPDRPLLSPTLALTLSIWVYPFDYANYWILASKCIGNGGSAASSSVFEWRLSSGNGVQEFSYRDITGAGGLIPGTGPAPPVNKWSHIAITRAYDIGLGVYVHTFYLNGVAGTAINSSAVPAVNTMDILVGVRDDLFSYFNGGLRDFGMWSAALAPAEVAALANGSASPDRIRNNSSLLGHWPILAGESMQPDLAKYGFHGRIGNAQLGALSGDGLRNKSAQQIKRLWIAGIAAAGGATLVNFSDSGACSDSFLLLANLPWSDNGAAVDAAGMGAILSGSDSGLGSDSFSIPGSNPSFSDSGVGVDSIQALFNIVASELGTGADTFAVPVANIIAAESAVGFGAVSLGNIAQAFADAGFSADQVSVITGVVLGIISTGRISHGTTGRISKGRAGSVRRRLL